MARDNTDLPTRSTKKGRDYTDYRSNLEEMSHKGHADHEMWRAANEEVRTIIKASPTTAEVHQNPILTNIALKYHNDNLVGESLMPVLSTDGQLSAQFFQFDTQQYFSIPDDTIAEGGEANEVSQNYTKDTVTLLPRGLSALMPQAVIQNATDPLKPLMNATTLMLDNLALARENRILTGVMTAGNYGANTTAIGAADRWNTAAGGDPRSDVTDAKSATFRGGGSGRYVGVAPLAVYNVLKQHDMFVDTYKYVTGLPGAIAAAMAEWLNLDEVVVPSAWNQTANEGQAAVYARLLTNSFAVLWVADNPTPETASFGYTFEDGPLGTEQVWNPLKGSRGGFTVKAGRNDLVKVTGPLTSYLVTTPIN